ncbi:hypothetical protein D2Q93_16955 [Alicyclobacillaceae bacterium I2511]|nr:hypothetical protein D2Q93_16955 [Alicyclobacillaceae bacterium I2511]
MRLHPKDLYPNGVICGAITERWLVSTVRAENGPATMFDEGLSYIVVGDPLSIKGSVLLKNAVAMLGEKLIDVSLVKQLQGWPVLEKLFDNYGMIPFHLHARDAHGMHVDKISVTILLNIICNRTFFRLPSLD